MRTRDPSGRHGFRADRASAALAAFALAACAAGEVPEETDAEPPLLSAQASGRPSADTAEPDQWLPLPESLFDAGVGSTDASAPGSESPAPDAGGGPAPVAMGGLGGMDGAGATGGEPAAPAPATDAPAPGTQPPPPAPACGAEVCNGLDDDCDGAIDDDAGCPCDVATFDGLPYLVCAQTMGWFAARNICRSVGYDLAMVDDAAEDAFLFGEIRRRGFGNTWLGLNDHVAEGTWVWLDGEPLPYSHWDSGEPNNGGRGGEDCGVLMTDDGRQSEWDDRECDSARPFLCELAAAP